MFIAYVGKERCDIVYYISKISNALNERTLLVDNSISGDLFRALTNDSNENVREFNGYTIVRNLKVTKKQVDGFDNVILYHGLSDFKERYEVVPDYLYVAVSVNKIELIDTKNAICSSGFERAGNKSLVLVDCVQKKYSPQTISENLGIQPSNAYIMPLDERDLVKYQMLMNNGSVALKKASEDMMEVVMDAMELLYDVEPKKAKKLASRL